MIWLLLGLASAHTFRPAVLDLQQLDDARWSVHWTGQPPLSLHLSGCDNVRPITTCADGLQAVEVRGIVPGGQVLVGIDRPGGSGQTVLTTDRPALDLGQRPVTGSLLTRYGVIGVEHIWAGLDHLLFVAGLSWLILGGRAETWRTRIWPLVKTLTGFTVGHSLTLTAAALGWISLPSAPVEAVIALSIVLLARELLSETESLVTRAPWAVAGGFGLIHGLGFAGALAELGLPETGRLQALVGFNLGVEVGQLLFVGVLVLSALGLPSLLSSVRVRQGVALGIGTIASAWTIDRVMGFF